MTIPMTQAASGGQTIAELVQHATGQLRGESPSPALDAELLLGHALGCNRAFLHAWPERLINPADSAMFLNLTARRARGEPVAYIIGEQEFWSLPLEVSADTLIPRPETELVVEQALTLLPAGRTARVADLGTGCGAIACAIAHDRPGWLVTATDRSDAALAVARRNARRLHLTNIVFYSGHWFTALPHDRRFDAIVANPPYIAPDDPHLQQGDLRFEPPTALSAADSGLKDLRTIIRGAVDYLVPGGWLILEHGYDQGPAIADCLAQRGYDPVKRHRDLSGHHRVTAARHNNN